MTEQTSNAALRGRAMSLLVHADTKVGKSTLASTCPKPMLLFDVEAAYRFMPISRERMRFWNPLIEAPPLSDATWDVCVCLVRDYHTMVTGMQYLYTGQHHFLSVAVDSISEAQDKCKKQVTSGGEMDQRKWGALLDHMGDLIRSMRDLTEHPTAPLEVVCLTAMTEFRDNKWRPYVQGQLRRTMPYFLDVIGYLYVEQLPGPDPMTPGEKIRRMLISPHPQFEAGERVQGKLGDIVDRPNIEHMLETIFGPRRTT